MSSRVVITRIRSFDIEQIDFNRFEYLRKTSLLKGRDERNFVYYVGRR